LKVLETYEGANNYILKLKQKFQTNKNFFPSRNQADYIITYQNTQPKVAKKWVLLDTYFAEKFADEKLLMTTPEKVWIEKLLVEKDKAYHVWGKFLENEQLYDFWLPKGSIVKNVSIEKVEVDYTKYSHRPPLEHQKEAIEKLVGCKRFILADDMGLGKTTSTIIAALETGAKKVLIVCPASLKINWEREIKNYTDRPSYICEGKNFSTNEDFIIINYDILKNFHDTKDLKNSPILNARFDLVILDEAHMISNPQAQRTKIVNSFCKNAKYLWLLTGTPMTNRPMNYYNLLNLIESPVSVNWMVYAIRYCAGYQFNVKGRKIWNVNGASNLEELRERTSKQLLRRLKTDVLDLPEKIITPVYLKLVSKHYEGLMGEYYEWYKKNPEERTSLTIQFSKLMKVRQVISEEKIPTTIELAENIIEQGKKVIIFTNFTETLKKIYEHFGKQAVYLDGSCSKQHRQNAVDEFQDNEKIKVFVGNMKAAAVGITLTSGEAVIMNDLSFVPADMSQAEDRAYRYGQKNSVSIYYPVFQNSIEMVIYDIINEKKQNINVVMGDNISSSDIVQEIMDFINPK
jgi:SWI/SNF-related matrix-associated actin-dependent regulator 1 of chromatin subfamily A